MFGGRGAFHHNYGAVCRAGTGQSPLRILMVAIRDGASLRELHEWTVRVIFCPASMSLRTMPDLEPSGRVGRGGAYCRRHQHQSARAARSTSDPLVFP